MVWLASVPTSTSLEALEFLSNSSAESKLKKYAGKQYKRAQKVTKEFSEFKHSSNYEGEKIGAIDLTVDQSVQSDPKKNSLLKQQELKLQLEKVLKKMSLFDANSNNTLHVHIKKFRVRSQGAKILLGNLTTGPDVLSADCSR